MKAADIKQRIDSIDEELYQLDEALASCDEICIHEIYEKESALITERFTLISQYEQLIAY